MYARYVSAILFGVLGIPSMLFAYFFFQDLWMHQGVNLFKRRRVLKSGTAAPARIVSAEMRDKVIGGLRGPASPYAIEYEVLPPGGAPVRATGIEVMTLREDHANLRAARRDGRNVQVRFDPQSKLVVLVRVDLKKGEKEHDATMQKAREARDALLRGHSGD